MAEKITELNEAQLAAIPRVRDEWLAHGLSTEPANRPEAENGVREAYEAAGLEPPKLIIWCDSPMAGAVKAHELTREDAPTSESDDEYRSGVQAQTWRAIRGQHDAGWLAFYDFFRTECGIEETQKLNGITKVAKSAGWWWPFENICVITERPNALHRDGQGRLHCEDGPALSYPDGFGVWSWHGVRVPRDLIEGNWDTYAILREPNAEIRRCAIEKQGWDVFVTESGMKLVASAPDPGNAPYALSLYDLPDGMDDLYDDAARILLCVNGTPEADGERRRFGLPVPAHHDDPVAAAADLYGVPVEMYRKITSRR